MMNVREEKLDETGSSFFYSASMLSADRGHAGIYHDILLYSRARTQAEHITADGVLASLISEQIMGFYIPSIINNYEEGNGGMRIC